MAEWSKALVLGTSLFGDVGSNPTAAKMYFMLLKFTKNVDLKGTAEIRTQDLLFTRQAL